MATWSQTLNALVLLGIADVDSVTLAGISTALTTWTLIFGYIAAKVLHVKAIPPPED